MRRSKAELKALSAAFESCSDLVYFEENIIAGCDDEDDISSDKALIDTANVFLDWYKSKIIQDENKG